MRHSAFIVAVLFICGMASALPSGWSKPEGYAYSLSLYAQVADENGDFIAAEGSALAAFDAKGVCRGLKEVATNARGVTLYQMSVSSNDVSESGLRLCIFNAETGEVLDIVETLDFTANAIIPASGGASHPQLFHVKPAIVLPEGWTRPEGYAYSLSLYAQVVDLNGGFIASKGSTLAAFDAQGNCRGLKEVATNARGVTLYQLSVSSNEVSEEGLKLRIFDAETGEVSDIAETLDFTANAIIPASGGASHPQVFHVKAPYAVTAAITIGQQTLRFGLDESLEDAFSPDKDVNAVSQEAYILGYNSDGKPVELQECYRHLAKVNKWEIAVNLNPGTATTIGWGAFSTDGYEAYILPYEDSPKAISMSDAGEIELRNDGKVARTLTVGVIIAESGALEAFQFRPGWNLVSFPFAPTEEDAARILALNPKSVVDSRYARARAIRANTGYWLFAKEDMRCVLEARSDAAASVPEKGWSLYATPKASPMPDGARAFGWYGMYFFEATVTERGQAYLIYLGK